MGEQAPVYSTYKSLVCAIVRLNEIFRFRINVFTKVKVQTKTKEWKLYFKIIIFYSTMFGNVNKVTFKIFLSSIYQNRIIFLLFFEDKMYDLYTTNFHFLFIRNILIYLLCKIKIFQGYYF